jgi:hypothetical protein
MWGIRGLRIRRRRKSERSFLYQFNGSYPISCVFYNMLKIS